MVMRYNMYSAAAIPGNTGAGHQLGPGDRLMQGIADRDARSMALRLDRADLLQLQAGNTADLRLRLAVMFVFLVLAAQYESWSLPLAVILVVPMCLFCSIVGVSLAGMEVNIFTQIGFVVLVGLASKNAILIVEFAKQRQEAGVPRREATLEACRLRLRPILMTSFAFILGVVPLVIAEGAGAECADRWAWPCSRHARRDPLRHLPDAGLLLRDPAFRHEVAARHSPQVTWSSSADGDRVVAHGIEKKGTRVFLSTRGKDSRPAR